MEIKLDESQPAFSEIDAIFLMKQLLAANTEVVKQTNSPRGLTKKGANEQRRTINAMFRALTGRFPTDSDVSSIFG